MIQRSRIFSFFLRLGSKLRLDLLRTFHIEKFAKNGTQDIRFHEAQERYMQVLRPTVLQCADTCPSAAGHIAQTRGL